jgi:hypothetical protein
MEDPANPPAKTLVSSQPASETACALAVAPIHWYEPPRLQIIHLLAWVTLGMLLLKFDQARLSFLFDNGQPYSLWNKILIACEAALQATLWIGGYVIARDLVRRKPGFFQPGHWLVIVFSCVAIEETLRIAFSPHEISGDLAINCYLAEQTLAAITMLLLVLFAAIRMPGEARWKVLFGLLACTFAVEAGAGILEILKEPRALSSFYSSYWHWKNIVLASATIVIAGVDLPAGSRKDWLHWLGIAYLILESARCTVYYAVLDWTMNQQAVGG